MTPGGRCWGGGQKFTYVLKNSYREKSYKTFFKNHLLRKAVSLLKATSDNVDSNSFLEIKILGSRVLRILFYKGKMVHYFKKLKCYNSISYMICSYITLYFFTYHALYMVSYFNSYEINWPYINQISYWLTYYVWNICNLHMMLTNGFLTI